MSASGVPVTLDAGQLTRVAESDTLNVGNLAPATADTDLTIAANGTGEVKLGAVGKNTRVLGDFYVDGAETITGGATFNGDVTLGDNSGDTIQIGGGTSDAATLAADLTVNNAVDVRFARATGTGVLVLPDGSTGEAGAIRVNSSNEFQWWNGSSWSTAGTSTPTALQAAYEQGSTITTNGTGGQLQFTVSTNGDFDVINGADSFEFQYGAADQLNVVGVLQAMTIDTAGAISLDAAAASNFTTSSGALTLDGNGGVNIAGNAAEIDVTTTGALDMNSGAGTWDSSAGISLDGAAASNFTVTAGDLVLSTVTSGELDLTSAGLMDVNAGANLDIDVTGTVDILASSTFSIDGTGASNVTADTGDLTVSTTTSGSLILDGVALVDLNAGANLDIDVTGSFDMLSTGVFSIDGTGASNVTATSGNLTLSTATSGNVILDAAGGDLTFDDSHYSGDGTYGPSGSMPFSTASVTDLTFSATCLLDAVNKAYDAAGGMGTWTEAADEAIAQYDIVSLDDGAAQGKVVKANSGTANQNFVVGVATAAATAGNDVTIQSAGKISVKTSDAGAWTVGARLYMSATDGEVTATPVTSGISQCIGFSLDTGTAGTRSACLRIEDPIEM